jgi:hypothetical protein
VERIRVVLTLKRYAIIHKNGRITVRPFVHLWTFLFREGAYPLPRHGHTVFDATNLNPHDHFIRHGSIEDAFLCNMHPKI